MKSVIPLKVPVLIVNFKGYAGSTGKQGLELAKQIEKASLKSRKSVAIAVNATDIRLIVPRVKIPVLAQHADSNLPERGTGSITVEMLKEVGACGTLINHSEKQVSLDIAAETVERLREIGLISVVCADTPQRAAKLSNYLPSFIAIEPPELIAGKVSISNAKPELITKTIIEVMRAGKTPVLCGAGVNSADDVKKAMELGSKGILLSSAIVLSKDPYKKTLELLEYL